MRITKILIFVTPLLFPMCLAINAQESTLSKNVKNISVYEPTSLAFQNLLDSLINYEEFFIKKTPNNRVVFFIGANGYKNDSIIDIYLASNTNYFNIFPEGILYYRGYEFYMYDGFKRIAKANRLIKKISFEEFAIISPDEYLVDYVVTVDWYWKWINDKFILFHKNEFRY